MLTSQGVKYAPTIKASNIVAGRAYRLARPGMDTPVMTVLWITPGYRLNTGASSISLHRRARVRLVDGTIAVGKFYANQGYYQVEGE